MHAANRVSRGREGREKEEARLSALVRMHFPSSRAARTAVLCHGIVVLMHSLKRGKLLPAEDDGVNGGHALRQLIWKDAAEIGTAICTVHTRDRLAYERS